MCVCGRRGGGAGNGSGSGSGRGGVGGGGGNLSSCRMLQCNWATATRRTVASDSQPFSMSLPPLPPAAGPRLDPCHPPAHPIPCPPPPGLTRAPCKVLEQPSLRNVRPQRHNVQAVLVVRRGFGARHRNHLCGGAAVRAACARSKRNGGGGREGESGSRVGRCGDARVRRCVRGWSEAKPPSRTMPPRAHALTGAGAGGRDVCVCVGGRGKGVQRTERG